MSPDQIAYFKELVENKDRKLADIATAYNEWNLELVRMSLNPRNEIDTDKMALLRKSPRFKKAFDSLKAARGRIDHDLKAEIWRLLTKGQKQALRAMQGEQFPVKRLKEMTPDPKPSESEKATSK